MTLEQFEATRGGDRVRFIGGLREATVIGWSYGFGKAGKREIIVRFDGRTWADGTPAADYVPYEEMELINATS